MIQAAETPLATGSDFKDASSVAVETAVQIFAMHFEISKLTYCYVEGFQYFLPGVFFCFFFSVN